MQLQVHSESHSFVILLNCHLGQSQSILNDQATAWQLQVSNCLIPVLLQKTGFQVSLSVFSALEEDSLLMHEIFQVPSAWVVDRQGL